MLNDEQYNAELDAIDASLVNMEVNMLRRANESLEEARQRDRARCKRAAKLVLKKSEAIRFITHHAKMATIRWQIDRRRLRRVLGAAKEHRRNHRAWEYTAIFVLDVLNEAYRREDELETLIDTYSEAAHTQTLELDVTRKKREELRVERDELRGQLKAVTDCIIHHAPSDFAILRYDSPAEALSALLGGKESDEETAA